MSEHDADHDPIDNAYSQAEAILSDESARAARRQQVLAAVTAEPATRPAVSTVGSRRPVWRRGGWLVAASVAGLTALVATQTHILPETSRPPPPAPSASIAKLPTPSFHGTVAPTPVPEVAPQTPGRVPGPRVVPPIASPQPVPAPSPNIIPPPPLPIPPVPRPIPLVAPAPVVVTAEKRAAAPNLDARLGAAAAAGLTDEVEKLLAQGAPVDEEDADGDTALTKSIRADHPKTAAALRRHGASLDHLNNAGETPRDLANALGDPTMSQALGLTP